MTTPQDQADRENAQAFIAYRDIDPSVCGFALFNAGWQASAALATAPAAGAPVAAIQALIANHGNAEDLYLAQGEHLNCPHCGGSGHVDDVTPQPAALSGSLESVQRDAQRYRWLCSYETEAGIVAWDKHGDDKVFCGEAADRLIDAEIAAAPQKGTE